MIAAPKSKCPRTTAQNAKHNTDSEIVAPAEKIGSCGTLSEQFAIAVHDVPEGDINLPIPAPIFRAKAAHTRAVESGFSYHEIFMMALIQCLRVNVDDGGWCCRSYGAKGGDVLAFESTLTAIAPGNIARDVNLTDSDRARLLVAARRINHASERFL